MVLWIFLGKDGLQTLEVSWGLAIVDVNVIEILWNIPTDML
jgi:hypothetical protein